MAGCGCVADLYLPAFKYLKDAELVAVIDPDAAAASWMARHYNVPKIYADVTEAAADPEIDAVIIGTPPNLHANHVEILAAAGKHILCDKPMASTVPDCQRIIDACEKNGVRLQMGHIKRFMRGNQKVRAIIDSGILGRIFMAECHWDCAVSQQVGTYREQEITGGGNLQDHGPHAFDLIRWWTGNEILEVSASIRSVHPQRPTEDTAVVILEHENGMVSCCHMTRVSFGHEHSQDLYRIYGTRGTLVVRNDHHFPTMSLESPEIILYRPGWKIQRFETYHGWNLDEVTRQNSAFYNQLRAFCDCIQNDTEPLVSGADGLKTIEATIAAYVSSWQGRKIRLPFRKSINLAQLFQEIKQRDAENLKYNYEIPDELRPGPLVNEPILGHQPPRTKEQWSDEKHAQKGQVGYAGLSGRIVSNDD